MYKTSMCLLFLFFSAGTLFAGDVVYSTTTTTYYSPCATSCTGSSSGTYACYVSCPPGWTPTGTCCRSGYYDSNGNWICTSYGTTCSPPSTTTTCCVQTYGRKKFCTPWYGSEHDPCHQWRDCKRCKVYKGIPYDCSASFREYRNVCNNTLYCR